MSDKCSFDGEKDKRLVELYQEYRQTLEGSGNASETNKKRKAAWETIATTINTENRTKFTSDQCRKRWKNLKSTAKSASTTVTKARKRTGGGEIEAKELSSSQQLVVGVLGESRGFIGEPEAVETPIFGESGADEVNELDGPNEANERCD